MTSTTKTSKKYLALVGAAAVFAAGVLLLTVAGTLSTSSAQSQEQGQAQQHGNSAGQNGTTTAVAAGSGASESVLI